MLWLIDGYNVVRRDPDLRAREAESLEAGRRALLHLLARAPQAARDEFTVVFDGARRSGGAPDPRRLLAASRNGRRRPRAAGASARKRRDRGQLGPQGPGRGPPGRQCRSDRRTISGSLDGPAPPLGRRFAGYKGRFRRRAGPGQTRQSAPAFQEGEAGPEGPRPPSPTLTLTRVS